VIAVVSGDREISAHRCLPAASQYDLLGLETAEGGHFGRALDLSAGYALATLEQRGAVIIAEA
jgi:hypothetical protein